MDKAISFISNNNIVIVMARPLMNPASSRYRTHNKYLRKVEQVKIENESVEAIAVLTKQGKTKQIPLGINSSTHKKIIISNATCTQLTEYARNGKYYENEISFSEAIDSLLKYFYDNEKDNQESLD